MIFIQEKKRSGFFRNLWSKKETTIPETEIPTPEQQQEEKIPVVVEEEKKEEEITFPEDLYSLYTMWCNGQPSLSQDQFVSWLMEESFPPEYEAIPNLKDQIKDWIADSNKASKRLLEKELKVLPEKEEENQQEEKKKPLHSEIQIKMAKDNMAAYLFVFPPFFEGRAIDKGMLLEAINNAGIKKGIDVDRIDSIAQGRYFQIFPLAIGVYPVHGADGEIIDRIPREKETGIKEDEKGNVDFKDLNLFQNIQKDDIICEIIPPTNGTDGYDVKGRTLTGKKGKDARVPAGRHTVLSQDKLFLLSESNGHIIFENGRFQVEEKLVISHDVDMSVGNLDFVGDIIIHGDVLNGFEVKAEGSVFVKGMVEGAKIIAGKDIEIGKGMNGNRQGVLRAQGNVKCTFLENSTIYTGGFIHAESIVCCDVFCDNTVSVRYGKGVIIGGNIMAMHLIEARIIGSKANRETAITLGVMPHVVTEKKEVEKELKTVKDTLEKLEKNINYLKSLTSLSPEKEAILRQLVGQRDLYKNSDWELAERLQELELKISDNKNCRIKCDTLYPPTRITINGQMSLISYMAYKCNIYLSSENEVTVGTI